MERVRQAQQPPEGHTRLYRYGEIATNFKDDPNVLRKSLLTGEMVPTSVWWKHRDQAMQGGRNTNPPAAGGRWFTDAPHELDYYINDNGPHAPAYFVDVPSDQAKSLHVDNSPYRSSSSNPDREFVVPDEHLQNAKLLLEGLLKKP
jgi:hypothetical protein